MSNDRILRQIKARLSLRPPQSDSLDLLDDILDRIAFDKDADPAPALAAIQAAWPSVTDFERDFPSLCFALATGVGKTRLMGAFISYLYLSGRSRNFFVLAPNTTIYDKLITDFTPNTEKYVFKGIAEFASSSTDPRHRGHLGSGTRRAWRRPVRQRNSHRQHLQRR